MRTTNKQGLFGLRTAAALLAAISALQAPALGHRAQQGLYNFNSLGGSYNPLGVLADNRLYWRIPLSTKDGPLWESARFDIGIQSACTPADVQLGLRMTLEPIGFFGITGGAYFYGLYTGLGYGMYAFDAAHARYNPAIANQMEPQSAAGIWLCAAPELKAKIGRFIAVNTATINAVFLDAEGYFIELRSYALHKTHDVNIINDFNALAEITPNILAGANYRFVRVFATGVQSHRISALAIGLLPKTKMGDLFAAMNAGYYLADPAFGASLYIGGMAGMDLQLGQRRKATRGRGK